MVSTVIVPTKDVGSKTWFDYQMCSKGIILLKMLELELALITGGTSSTEDVKRRTWLNQYVVQGLYY